jgi:hypothetical protein
LQYSLPSVPLFAVAAGGLLLGLVTSWIISLLQNIGTAFALRGKERTIADYKKENADLLRQVHQLELENVRLKTETHEVDDDNSL